MLYDKQGRQERDSDLEVAGNVVHKFLELVVEPLVPAVQGCTSTADKRSEFPGKLVGFEGHPEANNLVFKLFEGLVELGYLAIR